MSLKCGNSWKSVEFHGRKCGNSTLFDEKYGISRNPDSTQKVWNECVEWGRQKSVGFDIVCVKHVEHTGPARRKRVANKLSNYNR